MSELLVLGVYGTKSLHNTANNCIYKHATNCYLEGWLRKLFIFVPGKVFLKSSEQLNFA